MRKRLGLMMLGLLTAGGVLAQGTAPIVKVDDATIAPGTTGTVTVELTNAAAVGALRYQLTLPAGLTVTNPVIVKPGTLFTGATDQVQANVTGQTVDVVEVSSNTITGPGTILTIPVTADAKATSPLTISVGNVTAVDANNKPLTAGTPVNGTITVAASSNPAVALTLGAVTGNPGDVVSIPVTLSSATAVGAVHIKLCGAGGLKFTSADFTGSIFASPDLNAANVSADGTSLDAALVSATTRTGPGLLFTAKALVPITATAGQTFAVNACDATSISAIDANNKPIALSGSGIATAGVVTSGPTTPPVPSISVESANLVQGQPTTVNLRLDNAANIGEIDVTVQLSNPKVGVLVANSAKPADPKSTDVVQATAVGADKIRLVDVSAGTLASGHIATFQVQAAAALNPWDSSTLTITSATSLSADNKTIAPLAINPRGNGVLVAGKWVDDEGLPTQAAASVATVGAGDVAFIGFANGQLHAHNVTDGSAAFGGKEMVDLGLGPIIRRPTVRGGFVYVATGTGGVAKVDVTSGAPAWKVSLSSGRLPSTAPAVATDATGKTSVYVGTQQGVIVKLDDTNGAEQAVSPDLHSAVSADPAAGPAAAGGAIEVWVGAGNSVFQLDGGLAQVKKSFPTGGAVQSPPFISPLVTAKDGSSTRLVADGSGDGSLYVFNTGSGAPLGTYASGGPIVAATYVDFPSTAYLVNISGQLHGVSLAGLDLNAMQPAKLNGASLATGLGNVTSSIIAVGNPKFGYTTNQAGSIFGLKLPADLTGTATTTATVAASNAAFSPAASVGSSTVIVNTASGAIIALPFLK